VLHLCALDQLCSFDQSSENLKKSSTQIQDFTVTDEETQQSRNIACLGLIKVHELFKTTKTQSGKVLKPEHDVIPRLSAEDTHWLAEIKQPHFPANKNDDIKGHAPVRHLWPHGNLLEIHETSQKHLKDDQLYGLTKLKALAKISTIDTFLSLVLVPLTRKPSELFAGPMISMP
jgi:hypothetical protein